MESFLLSALRHVTQKLMSDESSLDTLLEEGTEQEESPAPVEGAEPKEEESEEELDQKSLSKIVRNLQKWQKQSGKYASETNSKVDSILTRLDEMHGNEKVLSTDGESYVTVSALRKELEAMQQKPLIEAQQMESFVNKTLDEARTEGILETQEEEQQFIDYALKNKEKMDLSEALDRWQERKEVVKEALKHTAKSKEKKEQGAMVGSSDRSNGSSKMSWKEIQATDLDDL
ncbi:MAG: hypothetical protein NVSMB66_6290 [Candidatus Doudnabacteria bacterium]